MIPVRTARIGTASILFSCSMVIILLPLFGYLIICRKKAYVHSVVAKAMREGRVLKWTMEVANEFH